MQGAARSPIAYQADRRGSPDIVSCAGSPGDLLSTWEQPLLVRHWRRGGRIGRILMLDKPRHGSFRPCARGAVPRDRDGRHPRGHGRRRVRARRVVDRDRRARPQCCSPRRTRPVCRLVLFDPRPEASGRSTTRGHRGPRSGGRGSPTCAPAGASARYLDALAGEWVPSRRRRGVSRLVRVAHASQPQPRCRVTVLSGRDGVDVATCLLRPRAHLVLPPSRRP